MNIPTLQDKRIVITGGARGLGRAFSEAALRSGARVIIGDKLEGRGRETAADLSQIGEIYFELIDIGCVTPFLIIETMAALNPSPYCPISPSPFSLPT